MKTEEPLALDIWELAGGRVKVAVRARRNEMQVNCKKEGKKVVQ